MQSLRTAHLIARFVLLWFVASIGVAIASPMVQPQAMQLVCSATGASKVVFGDQDGSSTQAHTLDCPLCVGLGAPPPLEIIAFGASTPQGFALPVHDSNRTAPLGAAPPPARGPPSFA